MSKVKFRFSKELKTDLANNGKDWDKLLFKACVEGKEASCKATEFCKVLRASGFRCGTGPARAAYKSVKDGGDIKAMIAAVTAVKAKRKDGAGKDGAGKDGAGKDGAGKDGAGKVADAETLVGALQAAADAASRGNLEVVETWILKAQALLATAKISTAQAVEKMGGVA